MQNHKIARASSFQNTTHLRTYSPDIQTIMQETLRTLANIDFEHQLDFEKLNRSNTSHEIKQHIARKLNERHQERREPYIRLMTELQTRILCEEFGSRGLQATGPKNSR